MGGRLTQARTLEFCSNRKKLTTKTSSVFVESGYFVAFAIQRQVFGTLLIWVANL